ncbi:carboxyl transferase domain-containing protein, partial [uncultured Actinomyces sp.]
MTTPNRFTREGFIQAQEAIAQAAEEKAAQRQHAKQKLTARERLALFFDDGVWHEVGQFIGGSVRAGRVGSAVAAGYGRVQGRMVAAYAQDFSVL